MTKNNADKKEDKKILTWKLQKLPTVDEVRDLAGAGIILPEEARQLLFKEETPKTDADRIDALETMVKTLQEIIASRHNIVTVPYVKTIEVSPRQRPYWNEVWMSTNGSRNITTTESLPNGYTVYSINTGTKVS